MKKIIPILALVLLIAPTQAESLKNMTFGNAVVSEVTSIYDGDTFRVNIAGWPKIIGYRIGIRVAGVDTPELRGKLQIEHAKKKPSRRETLGAFFMNVIQLVQHP